MSLLGRIKVLLGSEPPAPSPAYRHAVELSNDLINKFRKDAESNAVPTALMAAIWMQRHNVPFITTVYESTQEMEAATQWSREEGNNDDGNG